MPLYCTFWTRLLFSMSFSSLMTVMPLSILYFICVAFWHLFWHSVKKNTIKNINNKNIWRNCNAKVEWKKLQNGSDIRGVALADGGNPLILPPML